MAEPWEDALDAALGSINRLDEALRALPKDKAGETGTRLRQANRTVWNLVNQLEAHQVEHLYDIHAMLRELAKRNQLDLPDLWIELVQGGALKINTKTLIETARKKGIKPEDYLTTKEKIE